jgi:hypothetical protein
MDYFNQSTNTNFKRFKESKDNPGWDNRALITRIRNRNERIRLALALSSIKFPRYGVTAWELSCLGPKRAVQSSLGHGLAYFMLGNTERAVRRNFVSFSLCLSTLCVSSWERKSGAMLLYTELHQVHTVLRSLGLELGRIRGIPLKGTTLQYSVMFHIFLFLVVIYIEMFPKRRPCSRATDPNCPNSCKIKAWTARSLCNYANI